MPSSASVAAALCWAGCCFLRLLGPFNICSSSSGCLCSILFMTSAPALGAALLKQM